MFPFSLILSSKGVNSITIEQGVPPDYQEELFSSKRIVYNGQSLGLVVAGVCCVVPYCSLVCLTHISHFIQTDTQKHAEEAARKVKVVYDTSEAPRPVLSLEEAIRVKSFFPNVTPALTPQGPYTTGDVDKALAGAKHRLSNRLTCETQYHFTMETQTALAIPKENQGMVLHSSTQWPAIVQNLVARALKIGSSKITVDVKRIGTKIILVIF